MSSVEVLLCVQYNSPGEVQADPYKNLTTVFPEFYCTILSRIGTVDMETSVSNMIITTKV